MAQSMKSIVLKTSYELSADKSNEGIAVFATIFDQEFRELVLTYNERIKRPTREGVVPDANTATLIGLEWIQENLNINDEDMSMIVPRFINRAGDVAKIEELANRVNLATGR